MKVFITATFLASTMIVSSALAGGCGDGNHAQLTGAMAAKYFEQMDLNGDQSVTKAEFEKSPMAKMVKSFNSLGPNENGLVEKDAFIETFLKAHAASKKEV